MTEATTKRRPGRPRKHPETKDAASPPVVPTGLSAGLSAGDGGSALAPPAPEPRPVPPPAPPREEMRPDMRAEGSREEADRLAREWFSHLDSLGPQRDKYHVDPAKIPDGWSYEWRTFTVVNKENPQYQVEMQRAGWRPVPAKRHPELMPKGWKDAVVLIDGMMLMERPRAITEFQQERDSRAARAPIEHIRAKLTGVPQGQFPRGVGGAPANVSTQFGPMDMPVQRQ